MPRVSVVIPNYNHAAYIVETLDHLVRQTFEDWELIVVDDGSTDASLEILSQYEPHVTVLQNPHKGPAAARNAGIAARDSEVQFLLVFTRADGLRPPPARGHCLRTRWGKAAHALRGDSTGALFLRGIEHCVHALSGARQWSFREAPFERRVAGA